MGRSLNDGLESNISFLAWKSHRLKTTTPSTLSSETKSLSEGLAELEWVQALWAEAHRAEIDLRAFIEGYMPLPAVIQQRGDERDFRRIVECICTTDCKSVYDVLTKESSSADKRTAVELQSVKESLRIYLHHIRCTDTKWMLVDPLTKRKHDGTFLREVLGVGRYSIVEESAGLEAKKQQGRNRGGQTSSLCAEVAPWRKKSF